MRIREALAADVEVVAALERALFQADAWSTDAVAEELTGPDRVALLGLPAGGPAEVTGYAVARAAGEVWDLQRLGVDPGHRRQGVARALLAGLRERTGGATMMLEVAAGNQPALAFYVAEGFAEVDRRRRYYRSGEDAVVMSR